MRTGIELMYVEGEVRDGYLTGRRILVIETNCEIDPTAPQYSPDEIARLTRLARERWTAQFGPIDTVRLEQSRKDVPNSGRRIISQ
jgi:hypothetical protein